MTGGLGARPGWIPGVDMSHLLGAIVDAGNKMRTNNVKMQEGIVLDSG